MQRRDPEIRGDERTMLEQFLDYHRATVVLKVEGLTDEQMARTAPASELSLAGLLAHLALVEDSWFRVRLLGEEPAERWRHVDWEADPDWEFRTARGEPAAELIRRYEAACDASRDAVASVSSLDALSVTSSERRGGQFSLRWLLLHMIEETARHNGHADILRETIDGTTGD